MDFVTLTSTEHIASNSRVVAVFLSVAPAVLLSAGFCCTIAWCLSVTHMGVMLAVAAGVAVALSVLDVSLASKKTSLWIALAAASVALLCALLVPSARWGFYACTNAVIARVNSIFELYIPLVADAGLLCESVPLAVLAGMFAGSLAWIFANLSVSWPTLLIIVICGSASMELQAGDSAISMTLGVAGWLVQCRAGELRGSTVGLPQVLVGLGGLCAVCGALFALTVCLVQPLPALSDMSASAVKAVQNVRFGDDTLPEGDLSQAADMNEGDSTTLSLTAGKTLGDDLLLKGFVGTTFDGMSWGRGDWMSYEGEWSGMREWLRQNGLTVAEQRAAFDVEAEREGDEPVEAVEISVNASGANRRYTYAPYTLRSLSGADAMLTGSTMLSMDLMPSKAYSVIVDNVSADDVIADSSWLASSESDYAKSERVYAAFVRDKYLDVPEEERDAVNTYLFSSDSWDAQANVSDTAVISRVRTMMASLAGQTDTPPAYTGETSFVAWFLGSAHEGNSAYFATAATLAFRSQGIPARYVEGYRAANGQLAAAVRADVPLNLTAADAHAWTEIYLDGQGWTPVEVTPGYYSQTLDADRIIDVGEAWSNGANDKTLDVGSVAGRSEDKHREDTPVSHGVPVVAKAGVGLAGAAVAVLLALFVRRLVLRVRRARAIESDDQDVCVPALYGYLALVMKQSGVDAFDETKPLDCLDAFATAFPEIDPWEYRRAIQLHQTYAFGGRQLKPNELRTLRRLTERLHRSMPAPQNVIERFRRYMLYAL